MSKTINVSVELGGRIRSSDQLIKAFIRKCKKEGIVREYKESLVFETKSQKRRRKKKQGAARHRSKLLKEQTDTIKDSHERKNRR